MSQEQYMDEARQIAAQCWCDKETEHFTMIPELAEAMARRLATWMDIAAQNQRNADFYRDLLDKCADNLGPVKEKVFIQDDGGIVDSPLRLKLPDLVSELSTNARKWMLVEQTASDASKTSSQAGTTQRCTPVSTSTGTMTLKAKEPATPASPSPFSDLPTE